MASKLFKIPTHTTITSKPSSNSKPSTTLSLSFLFTTHHQNHQSHLLISHKNGKSLPKSSISHLSPTCTKEEAILQAKTSLLSTLEKPLNNPKLAGKLKKIKQTRFRVEIPLIDDSPSSLSELDAEIFGKMPEKRKGPQIKILILWPNQSLTQAAIKAFDSQSSGIIVQNIDLSSVLDEDIRTVNSADVAFFKRQRLLNGLL